MALSMDEQRILDEIEQGLAKADPVLAARLSSFGFQRATAALRIRRARLAASFLTLLVVAVVSLVVYVLVPFRSADRHGQGRGTATPSHPAQLAPANSQGKPLTHGQPPGTEAASRPAASASASASAPAAVPRSAR